MAENTNIQAVSPQEQQMLAEMQQQQMAILGEAAQKAGLNPENPQHKAAFEAHLKAFGSVKNEEEMAKLHEKVGLDFKGFQRQLQHVSKNIQTQQQQDDAKLAQLNQEYEGLAQESEALNKKKGTRNIITIIAGLAGGVGSFFLAGRFTKDRIEKNWLRVTTNIASAIAGTAIVGKLTSLFTLKPIDKRLDEIQAKAQDIQQTGGQIKEASNGALEKIMNEQHQFQLEFHTRSLKARLAEVEKGHTQTQTHQHAAGHHQTDTHQEAPKPTHIDDAIKQEREEGKHFAHEDKHIHGKQDAGVQAAAGEGVVIEKKKEAWDVAPKANNFASREKAPAENHLQAAVESKELANQPLALGA